MSAGSHKTNRRTVWIAYGLRAACGLTALFLYLLSIYLILQANIGITLTFIALGLSTLIILLPAFLITKRLTRRAQTLLLLEELEKSRRNFMEVTNRMLAYSNELDVYKEKLAKESTLRGYLARYVGGNVVERMARTRKEDLLGNERCEATLLFADICSFTTISERTDPEETIALLNAYFDPMVEIVLKHGGRVDKFVGDELMAVFCHQPDGQVTALNAVSAAIAMRKKVREMMQERNARGKQVFEVGIGVNSGQVVMGNVGGKNHMDYTVIGDAVNVAARLEQMAHGQEIIVGEDTYWHCKERIPMREKGQISVRNRALPVRCYEVLAD